MSDKIKKLQSELLYKNAIQDLQHELSNIEQFTFGKAATGRLSDIGGATLKRSGSMADLSKTAFKNSDSLSDLSKIGSKLGKSGDELGGLGGRLAKSGDELGGLGGRLAKSGDELGGLGSKLSKNSDELGGLGSKLSKNSDELGGLGSKLSKNSDELGGLGSKLSKNSDELGGLGSKLSKNSDELGDAGSKLSKNADELGDAAKKIDADDISKDAAKAAKKNLDDVTEGTKDVGTKAGKKVDDLGGDVADAQKQAKKWESYDDFKKWAAKNKTELIVGGVVLSVGVIAAIALAKFNELNNKEFNITKITTDADTGYIRVEYDPRQTLHEDDGVEITQSNCTPTINGIHKFKDLLDDSSFLIATSDITLEKDGTQGIFKYKTNFGNMFQTVIRDTVSGGVDTVNKGVLQPVVKGAADVTKDTLGSLFNAIIPAKYRTAIYWTLIITAILSVLCSIFLIYKKVRSELDV